MGLHQVEGKLTSTGGDIQIVMLNVSTRVLPGGGDEFPYETRLATTGIPDGDYVLEYHCLGFHRDLVRVKFGMLVAR